MEDDTISGGGILASSWFSPSVSYAPSQGRLNNEEGSWCPNKPDEDPNPYLQVSLLRTGLRKDGEKFSYLPEGKSSLLSENLPVFVGQLKNCQ